MLVKKCNVFDELWAPFCVLLVQLNFSTIDIGDKSSLGLTIRSLTVVLQLLSRIWLSVITMDCNTPGFPVHHLLSLLKLMSIELVTLSHHLILCCPLLLLPSIFPRNSILSNESAFCIRWPVTFTVVSYIHPDHNFPKGDSSHRPVHRKSVVPLWWPDTLGHGYVIGLVVYETMKGREGQKSPWTHFCCHLQ